MLFEDRLVERLRMMHGLDKAAAQQVGEFLGIERVVFVTIASNQTIAARLTDNQLIDIRAASYGPTNRPRGPPRRPNGVAAGSFRAKRPEAE